MQLIKEASDEKLRGGFYTPEPIASFILKWAFNGNKELDILEPSCGDGVFLKEIQKENYEYNSVTAIEFDEVEAEKSEAIGPGLPYADKSESWILNLPASMMGIERQQNNDFVNWLKKHDPDAIKDTHFPPRSCFGAYLMFRARELQEDASYPNVKVHYHTNQEVIGIKKKDGQFSVIAKSTSDSDKMILEEGDTLILATGHLSSALFPNLFGVSGYWEHPWSKQLYDSVKPEDSVWVVGTGPSAIDTCLRLLDEGKVTSVDMISRSGALPGVLSEASLEGPPYPLRHFNFADIIMKANRGLRDLSFLDLARRLWADIKEAEEETSGNVLTENDIVKTYGDLDPQIWIDREIKAAQKGPRPHQRVLYAAFPYISTLWGHLPVKDKLEFLRYKTTFLRYLSAMPLPNAVKLQGYMKKNLIRVHGGMHGVSECTKRRGSFVISSQEKGDSLQHFPTVVINATGPSTEIYTDPLITALIRGRLVQKHPAGGIDVDPDTLLAVDADGDVHSNLHILGELTSGPS